MAGMVSPIQIAENVVADLWEFEELTPALRSDITHQVAHEINVAFQRDGMYLDSNDTKIINFATRVARETHAHYTENAARGR